VTSSVIPYVCDQFAMARMSRATYALLVSLLPAMATVIGILVLGQIPSWPEAAGVALVIAESRSTPTESSRREPYPQPMEPAHGRRLSRLALTLWIAVPALVAVMVWGDPAAAQAYSAFVAVSAAALVLARR
jgi:hypothetical protein